MNSTLRTTEDPARTELDIQDPLPETNWFWRRVYTFALSLISVAFIWFGVEALYDLRQPDAIYRLTRYMIGVHVLLITYYMLAPSAEQLVKLVQAAKLLQSGVTIQRSATVESPEGGRAEVISTAGDLEDHPTPNRSQGASLAPERDVAPRGKPND